MNFLLINDDGIDAPGLAALLQCASGLGAAVVTAAPKQQLSGCGHQVTTKEPIKAEELPPTAPHEIKRWAIHGTPADCARLALSTLCPENGMSIDWVLSGINAGGNLGADVYTSGTVAAAREAAFFGIPGVAVSHHRKRGEIDWSLAQAHALEALRRVLPRPRRPDAYWNVNLPHRAPHLPPPEIIDCPLDTNPIEVLFRPTADASYLYAGKYRDRPRTPGADVAVCFAGNTSISELTL